MTASYPNPLNEPNRKTEEQPFAQPFNFEAAYLGRLPRLRRTEAHKLLEKIRMELVHGKNLPLHLSRLPHRRILQIARDQSA
ncbi:MAG: hypothetical protein R3236_10960 [Phycisphaeraceae bacterium]|nr:hypothetical protein [Phycisphaeraceae bacterium]